MTSMAKTKRMTAVTFGLAVIGAWAAVLAGETTHGLRESRPRPDAKAGNPTSETPVQAYSADPSPPLAPPPLAPPRAPVAQEPAEQQPQATSPSEEQARSDRLTAGRQTLLENLVASEAVDPSWAPDAEARIAASLRAADDELPQWTVTRARCATSLCEVQLDLVGSDDPGTAATDAALKVDWQGERFARVFVGDDASALLFLARDGELPWPAEPTMN